jgi:ribosomal protein L7Ae-like RNA K-turn-binding protein
MGSVFLFLGIARKAGKAVTGESMCENAIKSGKAYLVIIAEDASENTKKKFTNMSNTRDLKKVIFGQKNNLGHALGKGDTAVICIIDMGISLKLQQMLGELN